MEDHVLMRRSGLGGFSKEEIPVADDDSSGGGADEGSSRDDVAAKVGIKRAHHETEDLKPSLSDQKNKDLSWTKQVVTATNKERSPMDSDSKASSSSQKEQDNWLESARAEMGQVREENQRLKMYLGQMMKDYQALQRQFSDIIQQEETKKSTSPVDNSDQHQTFEEPELVSLSLGRFSSEYHSRKDGKNRKTSSHGKDNDDEIANEGLSLGLDCKFEVSKSHGNEQSSNLPNPSPVDSSEEQPREEAGETWPPKTEQAATMQTGEDEAVQQNPAKKVRVCVRARCDTPTMNDGCQWRKYGQKIAKGNPCPRAYYRCTVAQSCPVRKQVQRCADDMSILITTYEGTHNHPLPLSATAMASTTSAAASMLLSGSCSTSRTGPNASSAPTSIPADLHGLNFYLSNNSNCKSFYLQNSSLSPSPSHPTITLDLTSSNPSSSSPFNRSYSSTYPPIPKFAPTSTLNFGTSESSAMPWGNGFFSYGNSTTSQPYSKSPLANLNIGRSTMENNIFQSYMQKKTSATSTTSTASTYHQQPLPDTIAAATKAITADPSFQSALAAALTSIIGTGSGSGSGGGGGANLGNGDNAAQKLKWGEHFPVASSYSSPTTTKVNACATSYLNRTTSTNSQPGNLMFLPPNSLPFSSSKSASASPNDNRDHTG